MGWRLPNFVEASCPIIWSGSSNNKWFFGANNMLISNIILTQHDV